MYGCTPGACWAASLWPATSAGKVRGIMLGAGRLVSGRVCEFLGVRVGLGCCRAVHVEGRVGNILWQLKRCASHGR